MRRARRRAECAAAHRGTLATAGAALLRRAASRVVPHRAAPTLRAPHRQCAERGLPARSHRLRTPRVSKRSASPSRCHPRRVARCSARVPRATQSTRHATRGAILRCSAAAAAATGAAPLPRAATPVAALLMCPRLLRTGRMRRGGSAGATPAPPPRHSLPAVGPDTLPLTSASDCGLPVGLVPWGGRGWKCSNVSRTRWSSGWTRRGGRSVCPPDAG